MANTSGYHSGDLVFCHSNGMISRLIQFGQRIRWKKNYQYNHTAILDTWDDARGEWTVIQAEGKGVTRGRRLSQIAPGGKLVIVPLPDGANRSDFLFFLRSQVGQKYGFITDICIGFNILSPRVIRIDFRQNGTWICSAVIAAGLWFSGWEPSANIPDVYQVTPAELYGLVHPTA